MSAIFKSIIKMADGSHEDWYIELTDIADGRVEICKDLEEYSKKVEELGRDYGGKIDEVRWIKDDNVPPHIMDIVRFEMSKLQKEIEEATGRQLINEESK